MHRAALPTLCLLMMAACVQGGPTPPGDDRPGGPALSRCGGEPVAALMGRPVSAMPQTGGWTALRVIEPGMAVTQDFSETRLNVGLDHQGRIVGVACG